MKPTWNIIPSYPDYAASNLGEIKRIVPDACGRKPRELKPVLKSKGRFQVSLCRDKIPYSIEVSVAVAQAFLGMRPDGMFVCHKDGNALNNNIENLYYGTPKENSFDSIKHGTISRGSKNGNSKLNQEDVDFIRSFPGSASDAARIKCVSVSTACRIRKMEAWGHQPPATNADSKISATAAISSS